MGKILSGRATMTSSGSVEHMFTLHNDEIQACITELGVQSTDGVVQYLGNMYPAHKFYICRNSPDNNYRLIITRS